MTNCSNCEMLTTCLGISLFFFLLPQDLHEIWNSVSLKSAIRRNCIQELVELFVKYEIERATAVAYQTGVPTIIMCRLCVSTVCHD